MPFEQAVQWTVDYYRAVAKGSAVEGEGPRRWAGLGVAEWVDGMSFMPIPISA